MVEHILTKELRSLMFLPGSILGITGDPLLKYFEQCAFGDLPRIHRSDAFILDLEDSVAPSFRKKACRAAGIFLSALLDSSNSPCSLLLRITKSAELRELEFMLMEHARVAGVVIPKASMDDEALVEECRRIIRKPLLPIIETSLGMLQLSDILNLFKTAWPVQLLPHAIIGRDDLASDMGMRRDDLNPVSCSHIFHTFAYTSRACGYTPVGPVYNKLIGDHILDEELAIFSRLGFTGSLCVFPPQVRRVNDAYSVSSAEKLRLLQIRHKLSDAFNTGRGWASHDGKKYDIADLAYIDWMLTRADRSDAT